MRAAVVGFSGSGIQPAGEEARGQPDGSVCRG
jgi:hypothetical protein